MRVINSCLVLGVAAALLPQAIPHAGGISAILVVASAAVAFGTYLFGPRSHAVSHDEQAVAEGNYLREQSADFASQHEQIMHADEVAFKNFPKNVDVEPVWMARVDTKAFAKQFYTTTFNRSIAQRREQPPRAVIVYFDEKNENVQLIKTSKGARKVPRSGASLEDVSVIGSRRLH
ncbi:hypothetical protein [Bradyrhizobium sp. McL0616]|uniref:hypothetical protein n=1 Tax=Bradyrhizobium sp. McL0616 TaxID=3415674 RepID=UPI003CF10EB5